MVEGPVNSVLVFMMLDVVKEKKGKCYRKIIIIRYHFKLIWKHFVKPVAIK
jgi:hypothetical protein